MRDVLSRHLRLIPAGEEAQKAGHLFVWLTGVPDSRASSGTRTNHTQPKHTRKQPRGQNATRQQPDRRDHREETFL